MKGKALAILLAILVAGTAFALESGPSNPVGFFTVTVTRAANSVGYNMVSFPTLPASATLANTIGAQVPGNNTSSFATTMYWYDNTSSAYSSAYKTGTGTTWSGAFSTLESRKGYYIVLRNRAGVNLSYDVVVAGDVRTTAWDMGTIQVGYNMIGSVYAAPIRLDSTRLVSGTTRMKGGISQGQSDLLMWYNGSGFSTAYLNNSYVWQGTAITTLEPGKGYWIVRRSGRTPATFAWNDYPAPAGSGSSSSSGILSAGVQPTVTTTAMPSHINATASTSSVNVGSKIKSTPVTAATAVPVVNTTATAKKTK